MTETEANTLRGFRKMIAEWKASIEAVESGEITIQQNGSDAGAVYVASLRRMVDHHAELVEQYDPEGLTALGS